MDRRASAVPLSREERGLRDAYWAITLPVMESRALIRIGLSVAFLLLASNADRALWPGWVLLAGTTLSFAHARRDRILSLGAEGGGVFSRVVRWTLPYPESPHTRDLPGWLETAGLVAVAWAIGWNEWGSSGPTTFTTLAVLTSVAAATYAANLAAHINWEITPPSRLLHWLRPWIGLATGLVVNGLMWRSAVTDEQRAMLVIATAVLAVSTHVAAATTRRQCAAVRRDRSFMEPLVRERDSRIVHGCLKNRARPIFDLVERTDVPREVRDRVVLLCQSISTVEEQFAQNRAHSTWTAAEVIAGLRRFHSDWSSPIIRQDLDGTYLAPVDAEFLFVAVCDLLTNAYTAGQGRSDVQAPEVAVSRTGEQFTLCVTCHCGSSVTEVPQGGSLWRLARHALDLRGGLHINEGSSGEHEFVLTWTAGLAAEAQA